MGKIEFGTLYPYDIQPTGNNGAWDVVDHRSDWRHRCKDYDEAIALAIKFKNAMLKSKAQPSEELS